MPVSPDLTGALKKVVLTLEDDLRARVASQPEVDTAWRGLHAQAVDRERTAMSWQAWRDDRVTQAAVAWVLTSVFVRFCEDNRLLRPVWIAGPGERRQEALDAELQYFRENPEHTDREWLLQSVEHLAALRATRDLVGSHSPLWTVSPSGQAVKSLLSFWRETRDDGSLVWDFTDPDLSTRFLGDLYQDLSDYAKKTFALLQTPEFVEEFILDQTMEPSLAERPLEGFRMIDPTCGSGHFLLGAFARLNDRWATHAPGLEPRSRVQKALDAVHGVDLNPFAVAIARFRLMVAALQACEEHSLEDAPGFTLHLAAGDSLLHGGHQLEMRFDSFDAASEISGFAYDTEDLEVLRTILTPGRYDAVVGNPPYIAVKDATLNAAYRNLYKTCKGTYQLTVPFMERFFQLAKPGSYEGTAFGRIGQITSNGFMRRDFGAELVEDFLSRRDLSLVVDCEGVWIPGHNTDGTPTVMIFANNRPPQGGSIRAILGNGVREGRSTPIPSPYWSSIVTNMSKDGYRDRYLSVDMVDRTTMSKHPWSLSGGDVPALREALRRPSLRVADKVAFVGYLGQTNSDGAFVAPEQALLRRGVEGEVIARLAFGDEVRDYSVLPTQSCIFPYSHSRLLEISDFPGLVRWLWPLRTVTWARATFSKKTYRQEGRTWWEWHQVALKRMWDDYALIFPNISTHNHFVFDDRGTITNPTAVAVKLPLDSGPDQYLPLAEILNSSVTAFLLKDTAQPKGGAADIPFLRTYQVTAAAVESLPVVDTGGGVYMQKIVEISSRVNFEVNPRATPTAKTLKEAADVSSASLGAMIALQEELDWQTYKAFGLCDLPTVLDPPIIRGGERPFEIALARRTADGEEPDDWFIRHGFTPTVDVPSHWPANYRELTQRRIDVIAENKFIRLLERPEYKRRWATERWDKQVDRALRDWLLDRLEDRRFWFDGSGRPMVRSVGQLADEVSRDAELVSVLQLWSGRKDQSVTASLTALLDTESVPFLVAYRLKDSGLRKREAWEHTWDLQRREDAGEAVGDIPVPPKYTSTDFRKTSWWQHRGKLDVPKERFILYPHAGRETDPTPVLGWAGWDHAQQALALASLIQERETEGWDDERLIPLIAGLAELQPWVRQWHDETDPTFGVNLADYLEEQLRSRASQVARTLDELHAWRPAPPTRGRKPRA